MIPLPQSLAKKLDHVLGIYYREPGFCILRGLHPLERAEESKVVVFAGISSHIASDCGFQRTDKKHVLGQP